MNAIRLAALISLLASPLMAWDYPSDETNQLEAKGHLGLTLGYQDFDVNLDASTDLGLNPLAYDGLDLVGGVGWRPHPNWKVGLVYRLESGTRHSNDWVPTSDINDWVWTDSLSRWESSIGVDLSPRFKLDFLPEKNATAQLRLRYLYNLANGLQTLLVRPGVSWFFMNGREPVLSLHLAWEGYFGLNFSRERPYGQYIYLQANQPVGGPWSMEYGLQYGWKTWDESQSWIDQGWGTYSTSRSALGVRLGLVYRDVLR